jgi:hypothetical protein
MVLLRVEINSEIYSTSPWAFGVNRRYGTVDPLTDVGMPSRIVSIAAFHRRVDVEGTHSWDTLDDVSHMVYLPRLPPGSLPDMGHVGVSRKKTVWLF